MKDLNIILVLFGFVLLFSCSNEPSKKNDLYFYVSFNKKFIGKDKFVKDSIPTFDPRDSLIFGKAFEYKGKSHSVRLFTDAHYAAIDGGSLKYVLDDYGIIYGKSTTWRSYGRLKSNNDSINDLFQTAIDFILSDERFTNYGPPSEEPPPPPNDSACIPAL